MRHALLALLGILAVVSPASANWRSLKTDHFLVIGDATDRDLRDVALRLEQFRDVVGRMNPAVVRNDDAPPVVVLVFRSARAFEPFMPRSGGRTIQAAGYFQPGQGVNYIAMTTENGDDPMPTILHEFSHLLLHSISKDAPLWYQEGLAEYYSTFEVVDGGRRANIGKAIGEHVGSFGTAVCRSHGSSPSSATRRNTPRTPWTAPCCMRRHGPSFTMGFTRNPRNAAASS